MGRCAALDYTGRFGFLGPLLTLGHGVWLNEADLDRANSALEIKFRSQRHSRKILRRTSCPATVC